MSATDTSERELERIIVAALTGESGEPSAGADAVREPKARYGGAGYVEGDPKDYDRDHAVDLAKLLAFLRATQPKVVEQLGLHDDGPRRQQFLARLQGEITKRGIIDVLRKGVQHGPASVALFYGS